MIQVKGEQCKITFIILCLLFFFVKKDIFDRLCSGIKVSLVFLQ